MPELVLNKNGARAEDDAAAGSKDSPKPDWLGKFDAVHYRLGCDDVWVIGRLPGPVTARQRRSSSRRRV